MLYEDKEAHLIEHFQMMIIRNGSQCCVLPDTEEIQIIANSILDEDIWKSEWVDSSGKDEPPPDFYNDNKKLMLEVMRVDDHTFEENGRIKNPTNQQARKLDNYLKKQGFYDENPKLTVLINAVTDLPSSKDHNYVYYRDNFRRIIEKHKRSIPLYRENHPEYKLIFMVYDESSMYFKVKEKNKIIRTGELFVGEEHYWYYDKAFVESFILSGVDYLVWFAPCKYVEYAGEAPDLPMACIFDCNQIANELIEYDPDYMMSVEP